ncbi:hypothetical protein [Microbulbifer sp. SAOS-129_SWC]|uniref:hypothetical protein n=1 Tax=Microbulbifer sp. SAOS-129_SWC TaxID=3145235 RepID=UPI0032177238
MQAETKRNLALLALTLALVPSAVYFSLHRAGDNFLWYCLLIAALPLAVAQRLLKRLLPDAQRTVEEPPIRGLEENRIYQPATNMVPKLVAIFPLVFGLAILLSGYRKSSAVLLVGGGLLLVVGLWTLAAQSHRYIDLHKRQVVRSKRWLWFNWREAIPLAHFDRIAILRHSNSSGSDTQVYCSVNLVGRHVATAAIFFNINMHLENFFGPDQYPRACRYGERCAELLGIRFVGEEAD